MDALNEEYVMTLRDVTLKYKSKTSMFKRFEHIALSSVSLNISRGETLGILGSNGCGKSSLLRILAGIIMPTSGTVTCDKYIKRALLTLGLGFRQDLTGKDNALISAMYQGADKKTALEMLPAIKEFSELGDFYEQPVRTYSAGMRARLGFAAAVKNEVDVILIDEVLSVGDMQFSQKAVRAMKERINSGQTVVFVSHNIEQVRDICSRAIWLGDGVIKASGNVNTVAHEYYKYIIASSKT